MKIRNENEHTGRGQDTKNQGSTASGNGKALEINENSAGDPGKKSLPVKPAASNTSNRKPNDDRLQGKALKINEKSVGGKGSKDQA